MGTSMAVSTGSISLISVNNSKSLGRVCCNMNALNGSIPRSKASISVISSANRGLTAVSYAALNVGAIMKNVKNSANEIITVFGGVCCTPMAVRRNDRTMMIRVKLVIIIKMDGANDKTVNNAMSCKTRPAKDALPDPSPVVAPSGVPISSVRLCAITDGDANAAIAMTRIDNLIQNDFCLNAFNGDVFSVFWLFDLGRYNVIFNNYSIGIR